MKFFKLFFHILIGLAALSFQDGIASSNKGKKLADRKLIKGLNKSARKLEAIAARIDRAAEAEREEKARAVFNSSNATAEANADQKALASVAQHTAAGRSALAAGHAALQVAAQRAAGNSQNSQQQEVTVVLSDEMIRNTFAPVAQAIRKGESDLAEKIKYAMEIFKTDGRKKSWINTRFPSWGGGLIHLATREGNLKAVETLLLEQGLDPQLTNKEGKTALEVADAAQKTQNYTVSESNPLYGKTIEIHSSIGKIINVIQRHNLAMSVSAAQEARQSDVSLEQTAAAGNEAQVQELAHQFAATFFGARTSTPQPSQLGESQTAAGTQAAANQDPVLKSSQQFAALMTQKVIEAIDPFFVQLQASLLEKGTAFLDARLAEQKKTEEANAAFEKARAKHEADLKLREAQRVLAEVELQKQIQLQRQQDHAYFLEKQLVLQASKERAEKEALEKKLAEEKAKQAEIDARMEKERKQRDDEQKAARQKLQDEDDKRAREEEERRKLKPAAKELREYAPKKVKHAKKSKPKAAAPAQTQPEATAAAGSKQSKKEKRKEEREAEVNGLARTYNMVAQYSLRQAERRAEELLAQKKAEEAKRKEDEAAQERWQKLINDRLLVWLQSQAQEKPTLSDFALAGQVHPAAAQPNVSADLLACVARSAQLSDDFKK